MMFELFKSKVKVYFYHLFILALLMLCCFFLMYKDIKRIEGNVLNLRTKCTQLEEKSLANTCSLPVDNYEFDTEGNDLLDEEVLNEDVVVEEVLNEDVVVEEVLNEDVVVEEVLNEDVVVEDVNTDMLDENVLKELTLQNDDIDDLLNDVEIIQLKKNEDFSKLTESELLEKTNNELKEYLRNVGKSTSGNKKELVETILN